MMNNLWTTHPLVRALAACFTCSLLLSTTTGVFANAIDDPNTVSWSSVRGYSSQKYGDYFKKKSAAGYRVVDIEVYKTGGKTRYAAVWQFNTDKRGWASFRDMSNNEFSKKWKDYREKGYRLIDQESYRTGGKQRYAGVWLKNKENINWVSFRNVNSATFADKFKGYSDKGYRMIDIEAYKNGSKTNYSGIFIKNSENLAWSERRNMSPSKYAERFKDMSAKGYRVLDLESYRQNGRQQYAAIWVKNTNKRGWGAWRDMTAVGFGNKWRKMKDEGYRLIDFEAYASGGGTRYAGVWRQNGSQLNWPHKSKVDKAIADYKKKNGVPGMSVSIAENGKIVYARGFGIADIKKNKEAHAGTVYRLASVSKPITALIALRLDEKNQLELGDKTRTHAPSLPSHHTHTVRQLIDHKSGIRHYKGTNRNNNCPVPKPMGWKDSSKKKYKTATEAAKLFQGNPLMYTPGSKTCYSTHAYTVLAAALEGASKKSYTALVNDEISKRLKLPTLRPEEVNRKVAERSNIFSGTLIQTAHKPLNWKHAGGGLESSVIDLTKLGVKVIDGAVVKTDTRKKLWSGASFSHGGSQTGAKSYWRMYFNDDIVISVLSNRKKGDPGDLTNTIASIVK